MKTIELTQGKFALVDDEDYESLMRHVWQYTSRSDTTLEYATRDYTKEEMRALTGNRRYKWAMHRQIMNPKPGQYVDHINRNGLDNQKSNLRCCTNQQNTWNVGITKRNTSGYKGVSFDVKANRRQAHIHFGQNKWLGQFLNVEDAARAYNDAAAMYFGEFAYFNVIPGDQ